MVDKVVMVEVIAAAVIVRVVASLCVFPVLWTNYLVMSVNTHNITLDVKLSAAK